MTSAKGQEGFDFLGFHHRMVESWKRQGRYYLQKWPSPRAMASIRAKVRARTPRGYAGLDLAVVVEDLNPVLRGWGAYFRHGNSSRKFDAIDGYVHQRMAKLASVKHGTPGLNWATRFTYRWLPTSGSTGSPGRCATDCACLTMNDVGEPCAGEPHARFDRGPLAGGPPMARWGPSTRRETRRTEPTRPTGGRVPSGLPHQGLIPSL